MKGILGTEGIKKIQLNYIKLYFTEEYNYFSKFLLILK